MEIQKKVLRLNNVYFHHYRTVMFFGKNYLEQIAEQCGLLQLRHVEFECDYQSRLLHLKTISDHFNI
jgi:hypothetical protein